MPQPLSRVAPKATYYMGNAGQRVFAERPALAVLAMEAIASWSNVEAHMLSMFVEMMGGKANRASAVYLALNTQSPKTIAIQAVARASLSKQRKAVLDAILAISKTNQAHRDRLAHGVWGYSDALPDALLLASPHSMHSSFPDDQEIYVYKENDFTHVIEANDRLCGYAGTFWHLVRGKRGGGPVMKSRDIMRFLLLAPEIQERLSRRP